MVYAKVSASFQSSILFHDSLQYSRINVERVKLFNNHCNQIKFVVLFWNMKFE